MTVMKREFEQAVARACTKLFNIDTAVELVRPDEQYGDFATSIALQLASQLHQPPGAIASQLQEFLEESLGAGARIAIAGPGFLNITMSDRALLDSAERASTSYPNLYKGAVVVSDYSDPNPFKALHVGHLYTSIVGDAVMNLIEQSGGSVHRTNFGGDVGMHVGKAMWAIVRILEGEHPDKLAAVPAADRADWLSKRYVEGNTAYEDSEQSKQQIIETNKRVYALHEADDHTSPFARIYWTCRQWSYDYFDAFYARIGSHFEKYYPESSVAALGVETVRRELKKGVYAHSDGAVVFVGEPYGLHTRVFINSQGLPTYEAKDVGLIMAKWRDYHFDKSIIITGSDIIEYMKVVVKSIEQFAPDLAHATVHITHGNVKMKGGIKMSSRKGNVLLAIDVLDMVNDLAKKMSGDHSEQTMLAAVKYAFLKQRIGQDVIYDPEESVSLEGNSGPYIQYAHARACSILRKAGDAEKTPLSSDVTGDERRLARKLTEFPEVVERATRELLPHHICTYLYELAQTFNSFYEHNRVIGDQRQGTRLALVNYYAQTLKSGLTLLGITAPDTM